MSKLSPARKLALDVLMEADRRGMYARDVLSARATAKAIDQRDSAFAARLALGVAATQGILDELLDQFLDKPKKVAPRVRMALRISAFEMLYLHTPGRVAVSQGVSWCAAELSLPPVWPMPCCISRGQRRGLCHCGGCR